MSNFDSPRVALVTGGAVRVGRAVVSLLAERGYAVAIHVNRSVDDAEKFATELAEQGASVLVVQADLRDETATRQMIDQVFAHFGRLDVLVNSAAMYAPKALEEVTADDVRDYFDVNTLGTFICCQHAGLKMADQETGGVIVNIGDWSVARPYPDYAHYFPSKGAIPTLTRMFAVELSERNTQVRVNAVLPGPVVFPPNMPEEEREQIIASTLLKRAGRPENVAQAVLFFVENDYVTGVCVPVDGGRTIGH
jgi:pteridine reductase